VIYSHPSSLRYPYEIQKVVVFFKIRISPNPFRLRRAASPSRSPANTDARLRDLRYPHEIQKVVVFLKIKISPDPFRLRRAASPSRSPESPDARLRDGLAALFSLNGLVEIRGEMLNLVPLSCIKISWGYLRSRSRIRL